VTRTRHRQAEKVTALCALVALVCTILMSPFAQANDETGLFGSVEVWVGDADEALPKARFKRLVTDPERMDPMSAYKWDILITLLKSQSPLNQLRLVQQFVNGQPYRSDESLWKQGDYWSSVTEFLHLGGDCEDFALTKYRALIDAGFPATDLRLVLVEENFTGEQHAILAAELSGRRFVLDNRRDGVEDHELISNYRPLYSMNASGLWRHHGKVETGPDLEVATRSQ